MKVIELLNKIANGEEVPKYINYTHKVFGKDTMMVCKENIINELDIGAIDLNDEVEIIEEDKFKFIDQIHNDDEIPQKYNSIIGNTNLTFSDLPRITWYKVNELIDEVNKLRKNVHNLQKTDSEEDE